MDGVFTLCDARSPGDLRCCRFRGHEGMHRNQDAQPRIEWQDCE